MISKPSPKKPFSLPCALGKLHLEEVSGHVRGLKTLDPDAMRKPQVAMGRSCMERERKRERERERLRGPAIPSYSRHPS